MLALLRMTRRQQLEKLIAARARSKTADFARLIQRSDAVVYQLRRGIRELGDALARHIEITCGVPQGWFDTDDDVPLKTDAVRAGELLGATPPPITTALPVVLDAIAACPHRDELRTLLALLVDHDAPAYRARLAELLSLPPPSIAKGLIETGDFAGPAPSHDNHDPDSQHHSRKREPGR